MFFKRPGVRKRRNDYGPPIVNSPRAKRFNETWKSVQASGYKQLHSPNAVQLVLRTTNGLIPATWMLLLLLMTRHKELPKPRATSCTEVIDGSRPAFFPRTLLLASNATVFFFFVFILALPPLYSRNSGLDVARL